MPAAGASSHSSDKLTISWRKEPMPPRGFEPLITGLKGRRPSPLDDGGRREYTSPLKAGQQKREGRSAFRPPTLFTIIPHFRGTCQVSDWGGLVRAWLTTFSRHPDGHHHKFSRNAFRFSKWAKEVVLKTMKYMTRPAKAQPRTKSFALISFS